MLLLVMFALICTDYIRNYSRTQRTATAFCDLKLPEALFERFFTQINLKNCVEIISLILDENMVTFHYCEFYYCEKHVRW